ncbi:VWA domain-containing protein [Methanobacterium sp. MBAC-LM]|uniref:VWA domain-containing protein n=1 Tax=Methanobacterium sp. MBAC-LM TaxID=3412034 RepID=UPI003C71DA83
MLKEIAKFSGKLRENGIPASIRSTEIACQAVPLIKENDGDLREALACIYLKDQRQRKRFNEIYSSFFGGKGSDNDDQSVKEQSKHVNHRSVKSSLNVTSSPSGTNNVPGLNSTYQAWDHRMNHINDSIMDKIKIEYIENTLGGSSDDSMRDNSGLLKSNIMTLNSLQPELIDLCQKLGRKIATKRARRYKQSKKQKPDIRRTIRKNLKHGGSLLELVKSKPKLKKQNHYFLNDVSVSCDWISIWFFCMVYAAQNSFTRARAFEFDNRTAEVTSALYELNVVDAFVKVLKIRQENAMIHGKSNMYTAFEGFLDQANLNSKSYVMILSDCRDWAGPKHNKEPLSAEFINQMSKIAKRVLILNPEPKNKWNVADSRVSYYEKAGAEIFEVRDLEQLANLISEI